jgi:hypothetical protein
VWINLTPRLRQKSPERDFHPFARQESELQTRSGLPITEMIHGLYPTAPWGWIEETFPILKKAVLLSLAFYK